ncbi:MAG: hypothetical protein J07HQX50_01107 [Haloquadratum sp. J07HQX50]|nr:MAG: hypothetical protein J07HQX50_01107 [Haloquadratum sp. J07HQX50]
MSSRNGRTQTSFLLSSLSQSRLKRPNTRCVREGPPPALDNPRLTAMADLRGVAFPNLRTTVSYKCIQCPSTSLDDGTRRNEIL